MRVSQYNKRIIHFLWIDSQFGCMVWDIFSDKKQRYRYVLEIMRLAHTFVDSLLIQIILSASFEPKSCREGMKR